MNQHQVITHKLISGSPEWKAYRFKMFGASEAAAMLGLSPKTSRTELMNIKHTGNEKEFSDWVQKHILDKGHEVEALALPIVEELIGDDLYPVTLSTGRQSASCDGLTLSRELAFEHKQWNERMAEQVSNDIVPEEHMPQCQQVLKVSGAKKLIFVISNGTAEKMVSMFVYPDREWFQRLDAGWAQFEIDLAAYVPAEVVVPAIAAPQLSLPAVSIQVNGSIALVDNLPDFGVALTAYIARINKKPETDQDFADLELTVKRLQAAEVALDAAENGALAQTESIDSMRRTVALYREMARTNRILVEKLVKAEKENRRTKIISDAVAELHAHMNGLNARLGKPYMPALASDFQGVVKGLKSIDSMKDKVATELARCKIEANSAADRIQANLTTLRELAKDHVFLFADTAQIVMKANDDLTALVTLRISEHQAAEDKKAEQLRESIRKEEAERLEHEQRERRADITAIRGWYDNYCATLDTVESGLKKVAAWIASPIVWGEMIDEAKAAVEEQRVGLEKRREFLLNQQPTEPEPAPVAQPSPAAPAITHEVVTKIMMPPAVRQAMVPKADTPPTLALGEISTRLRFNCTSAFLATLGFEATTVKAAKLFHEADFTAICQALITHISEVQDQFEPATA